MNLLIIGQSHVAAFRAAARTHRDRYPDEPRTRVIHTLEDVYAPELQGVRGGDYQDAHFGPGLVTAIEDQLARHQPRVASVIGGNGHNTLALMRHPRPWDFLLSGVDGPPLDPTAELIPESLVRAAMLRRLEPDLARMRSLRAVAGSYVQIESPPPLRDEGYIAARAEAWFRDQYQGPIQVAPFGLRWRIWRLASQMVQQATDTLGLRYMVVPRSLQDRDGSLLVEFAADPTHGNGAYGEALIRALEEF